MAFLLHQNVFALSGEQPHRHVIGQRSGRKEEGLLLPQRLRKSLFQLFHRAAFHIYVGRRLQFRQKTQIFFWRQIHAVPSQRDALLHRLRQSDLWNSNRGCGNFKKSASIGGMHPHSISRLVISVPPACNCWQAVPPGDKGLYRAPTVMEGITLSTDKSRS